MCTPRRTDGYPLTKQEWCKLLGVKGRCKIHSPGFGSLISSLLWNDYDGMHRVNPLLDCSHSILEDKSGRMHRVPVTVPRPYGSEGCGFMQANLALDDSAWSWWHPMENGSVDGLPVSVFCNIGLRNRGKDDMPYVRLWWNLLNIFMEVQSFGMEMETWNYKEYLDHIMWNGLGDENLPAAYDVMEYFLKACEAYDKFYHGELGSPPKAMALPSKSFQDWYSHVWVRDYVDGSTVRGEGEDLV